MKNLAIVVGKAIRYVYAMTTVRKIRNEDFRFQIRDMYRKRILNADGCIDFYFGMPKVVVVLENGEKEGCGSSSEEYKAVTT